MHFKCVFHSNFPISHSIFSYNPLFCTLHTHVNSAYIMRKLKFQRTSFGDLYINVKFANAIVLNFVRDEKVKRIKLDAIQCVLSVFFCLLSTFV